MIVGYTILSRSCTELIYRNEVICMPNIRILMCITNNLGETVTFTNNIQALSASSS